MKGVILACFKELVVNNFGENRWREILKKAGFPENRVFLATEDVSDEDALRLVKTIGDTLGMSSAQLGDAFGDYWVNNFAPKIYKIYYQKAKNAKEFILAMDEVHQKATKTIPNARPPRFDYEWKDDKTLIITYKSKRGLIDLLVGLIKGVGKYFNEDLKVTKLDNNKVEVIFP